ncbi:hypothetical protein ACXET9_12925 [Brachybacterium sp. DNPG3]
MPRISTMLGIPAPLLVIALLLSAVVGLQLSGALETATTTRSSAITSVDSTSTTGKNSSGLPVVTDSTLGTEVQRQVDTGAIQPMTSFDAAQCLAELGITDSVQIMEEVAWGTAQTPAWLLVYGPGDRDTLRAAGGTVKVTVVLPTCGNGDDTGAADKQLWSGSVLIGSV